MSEPTCEICGRTIGLGEGYCAHGTPHVYEWEEECYRLGYERTLARADRYEAEFSACKALLIAEQKRAERAEAERAGAEAQLDDCANGHRSLEELRAARVASEARCSEARSAALEEAARYVDGFARSLIGSPASVELFVAAAGIRRLAEPARDAKEPAPLNPPPSPTGDAE